MPVALAAADAGRGGDVRAGDLRDDALDRPARRELDDGEADQHDPEQGRDDEQDALEKIGGHRPCACPISGISCDFSFAAFSASYHHVSVMPRVVLRLHARPAEFVPEGDVVRGLVPVWHPVVAGAQHAVERARGRHKLLAACWPRAPCRSGRRRPGRLMPARLTLPSSCARPRCPRSP